MLKAAECSLVCPCNDLESATILEIAADLGLDCRSVAGSWGLTLDEALLQHPDIAGLREHVIVVELPGDDARERLERSGKIVHQIDHHGLPDATAAKPSSLEQFAALLAHPLTREQYLIAIADRDFLPGLSAAGATWQEAIDLRQRERQIRGETADYEAARTWADARRARQLGERETALRFMRAPARFQGMMLDVLQEPNPDAYTAASKKHEPLQLPAALVILHADDPNQPNGLGNVVGVRYAGPPSARAAIAALRADSTFEIELNTWSGGGRYGCYFGADARPGHPAPPFDALVSRLLGYVLGTATPLREYRCTFLLPLDLFADDQLRTDPAATKTRFDKLLDRSVTKGRVRQHQLSPVPQAQWTDIDDERMLETEARLYFLPHLQDVLFETAPSPGGDVAPHRDIDLKPILRYRLPETLTASLRWSLPGGLPGDKMQTTPLSALVTDCSLYRYYNGLFVLAVGVTLEDRLAPPKPDAPSADRRPVIPGTETMQRDNATWWHPLFDTDRATFERIASRQLDHWLRFTKHARILYRSFIEQISEYKFERQRLSGTDDDNRPSIAWPEDQQPLTQGENLSPIIYWLLQRFFSPETADTGYKKALREQLGLQYLCEERMFVNVAYALCGETLVDDLGLAQRDRLFSLALYVDKQSDTWGTQQGYAYDRSFTKQLLTEGNPPHRLDRWRGVGTLSGYGPYANAYLGSGSTFADLVARRHVPYHYERMLVLVLFYQLTLRGYNRRISHATNRLITPGGGRNRRNRDPGSAFRKLRRGFIEFTNNYWFREITLAIQGKEIFARQVAAAELESEYQEIKDEMERADEYAASLREGRLNDQMALLAVVGLFVGVAALWDNYARVILLLSAVLVAYGVFCRFAGSRRSFCNLARSLARLFGFGPD